MSTVDSLVVELGVKSDSLMDGLNRAISAIEGFSSKLEGVGKALDSIVSRFPDLGESAEKGTDKARQGVRGLGQEVRRTGEAAEGAARKMADSFNKVSPTLSKLKALLVGYFGTRAMFGVAQRGTEFDRFARRTGIDTTRADAWGRATEKAGGSAQAFREALKEWKIHGRSEEDFYAMGDMMKGMNGQERSWFLKSRGVSEAAGAAFMEYGDRARDVAAGYKSVAITPAQQKIARDFVDAFYELQVYVEAIGRKVGNVILPVATNIFKRTKAFLDMLLRNGKAIEKITLTIGTLLAIKWVLGLKGVIECLKKITILQKLFNALSFANPIGILVAGLAIAAALIDDFVTYLQDGDSIIGDIVKWFKELAPKISDAFSDFFSEIYDSFLNFVDDITEPFVNAFHSAYDGICQIFRDIWAFISETIIAPIEKFFGGIADKVKGIKSFFGFGDGEKGSDVKKDTIYRAMYPNDQSVAMVKPEAEGIVAQNSTSSIEHSNNFSPTLNYDVTVNGVKDASGFSQAVHGLGEQTSRAITRTYSIALSGNNLK